MLLRYLKRGEDKRVKGGHPWIFSNEIQELRGDKSPGAITAVYDSESRFVGTGFYSSNSLISVRLLSRQQIDIESTSFLRERIEKALCFRHAKYPGRESFRVVYGEGDFLPGLIVD